MAGKGKRGKARHAIVTAEQLDKSRAGHWSTLALLLRNPNFQRHVKRINIDEAHCLHIDGLSHYGLPAFRPAWNKVGHLKALLPRSVQYGLFSATIPPHIRETIKSQVLGDDFHDIHITSNRPNTTYMFHTVNSLEDMRNYLCFLANLFSLDQQCRILIFVDNKKLGARIVASLSAACPKEYQRGPKRLVRLYHSLYSSGYLQETYEEFTKPNGHCFILVTTSGNAVVCGISLLFSDWIANHFP